MWPASKLKLDKSTYNSKYRIPLKKKKCSYLLKIDLKKVNCTFYNENDFLVLGYRFVPLCDLRVIFEKKSELTLAMKENIAND